MLDNNEMYRIIRRSVIFYFAKNLDLDDKLMAADFEPVMKFVGDCYKSWYKLRVQTQERN